MLQPRRHTMISLMTTFGNPGGDGADLPERHEASMVLNGFFTEGNTDMSSSSFRFDTSPSKVGLRRKNQDCDVYIYPSAQTSSPP
jgi:hypothetical protein